MLSTMKHIKSTNQSLPEQVAAQINQLIIDQNIGPEQKLPNEFELAERLNVGRGTIREAVKLLVARNCLEVRRGKGTFVVEKTGQIEDPLGFAYVFHIHKNSVNTCRFGNLCNFGSVCYIHQF